MFEEAQSSFVLKYCIYRSSMIEMIITASIVLYFFTKAIYAKPPAKTVEEQLGESITKYLTKGVKVRLDKD